MDQRWRGQRGARARRHAHRSSASGRSGAPKLTGGGVKGREDHGELGSGDGGAEPRGVVGVVNADVDGFNAIEDGGGFKREIKEGEMKARW
jgi:hypothetical protein